MRFSSSLTPPTHGTRSCMYKPTQLELEGISAGDNDQSRSMMQGIARYISLSYASPPVMVPVYLRLARATADYKTQYLKAKQINNLPAV